MIARRHISRSMLDATEFSALIHDIVPPVDDCTGALSTDNELAPPDKRSEHVFRHSPSTGCVEQAASQARGKNVKTLSKTWAARAFLLVATICLGVGDAMAIEEAEYRLIEQAGDFELRRYEPYIVAETMVDGAFSDVGNEGFRRLAAYIFGENRKKVSMDMTAPVNQTPGPEKIAMTAPVNQTVVNDKWLVTFTMPAEYTMETLPEPLDPRVVLRREPGRLMAVVRYSGTWSQERYSTNEQRLRALILEHGLEPVGDPIFARYNPPFTLWFLRRNEVLIPVRVMDHKSAVRCCDSASHRVVTAVSPPS